MSEYWDEKSKSHFAALQLMLTDSGVPFTVNPRLVRGLDYYSRTVFEWITDALGSQNAVCSGGRYDGLIALLGGTPTPAIGWALGMERIVLLLKELGLQAPVKPLDGYLILVGEAAQAAGIALSERLRDDLPTFTLECELGGGGFKGQFKRADKSGARFALILGEEEVTTSTVSVKPLRGEGEQQTVPMNELASWLRQRLPG